jgi:transposase
MRGRLPSGPEYVDQLAGSDQAKERLKTVLETLAGTCRIQEACQRLGISEPRFHQLRLQVLEAGLAELEPRTRGRPPKTPSLHELEIVQLKEQLAGKEMELHVAQVREEIAQVLPQVVNPAATKEGNSQETTDQAGDVPEKKTRRAKQLTARPRRPPPPRNQPP